MQTNYKKILMIAMPITLTVLLGLLLTLVLVIANAERKATEPAGFDAEITDDEVLRADETHLPVDTDAPETGEPAREIYSDGLEFVSYGNGTCYLAGVGGCKDTNVKIPPKNDDGEVVIAIGANALKGESGVWGVEICDTVRTIGSYAFYNSGIREVTIPKSVSNIGDYAFCNCRSLTSISVDGANQNYNSTDGVLFNKDRTVLICYPAGLGSVSYTLPTRVSEIRTMAFYNCARLSTLNYSGSSSQYDRIVIGAGNDVLDDVKIIYVSSGK